MAPHLPLDRPSRRARILRAILRLEARIRHDRELLYDPRRELAAARQIAAAQRQLGVLRRRLR